MSLAEIKKSVAGLTVEERFELAAYIAHLNRLDDPEYRAELEERMAAMDSGRKTTSIELESLHEDLVRRGR
jgi:hypothetical protein